MGTVMTGIIGGEAIASGVEVTPGMLHADPLDTRQQAYMPYYYGVDCEDDRYDWFRGSHGYY